MRCGARVLRALGRGLSDEAIAGGAPDGLRHVAYLKLAVDAADVEGLLATPFPSPDEASDHIGVN